MKLSRDMKVGRVSCRWRRTFLEMQRAWREVCSIDLTDAGWPNRGPSGGGSLEARIDTKGEGTRQAGAWNTTCRASCCLEMGRLRGEGGLARFVAR